MTKYFMAHSHNAYDVGTYLKNIASHSPDASVVFGENAFIDTFAVDRDGMRPHSVDPISLRGSPKAVAAFQAMKESNMTVYGGTMLLDFGGVRAAAMPIFKGGNLEGVVLKGGMYNDADLMQMDLLENLRAKEAPLIDTAWSKGMGVRPVVCSDIHTLKEDDLEGIHTIVHAAYDLRSTPEGMAALYADKFGERPLSVVCAHGSERRDSRYSLSYDVATQTLDVAGSAVLIDRV